MAADTTPEEPYVFPETLGKRIRDLSETLRRLKAEMESGSPMAAMSYALSSELLLDLLPDLLLEHRRMAAQVTRDPMACNQVFLRCDQLAGHLGEHYDRYARTEWFRGSSGTSMTYVNR